MTVIPLFLEAENISTVELLKLQIFWPLQLGNILRLSQSIYLCINLLFFLIFYLQLLTNLLFIITINKFTYNIFK